MSESIYQDAAQALRNGEVIAYPTEAVWGVGCDPFNEQAVQKLLDLKSRPVEKGVILAAGSIEQVAFLLDELSSQQRETVLATWPGPYTWILPDPKNQVPQWIKGDNSGVAVRVSAHSSVKSICQAYGHPIVSTSANPAGEQPARTQGEVSRYFASKSLFIVPGELGGQQKPTEIRDLTSGGLVRES